MQQCQLLVSAHGKAQTSASLSLTNAWPCSMSTLIQPLEAFPSLFFQSLYKTIFFSICWLRMKITQHAVAQGLFISMQAAFHRCTRMEKAKFCAQITDAAPTSPMLCLLMESNHPPACKTICQLESSLFGLYTNSSLCSHRHAEGH